jgi:hypothetical protein
MKEISEVLALSNCSGAVIIWIVVPIISPLSTLFICSIE